MRYSSRSNRFRRKRGGVNFKKIGTLLTLLVFVVMIFTSVRYFTLFNVLRGSDMPTIWRPEKSDRNQILLVGTADGQIISCTLLSITADESPVNVLRVPPHTLVPGQTTQTIAEIFNQEGVEAGISGLNGLLNNRLPVNKYLVYDVAGIGEALDSLNGVDVKLSNDFTVRLDSTDYRFSGSAKIDSTNLFPFVNSESQGGGFWAERALLVGLFNDLFHWMNLGNLVSNLRQVSAGYETNMSSRELAWFRDTLQALDEENSNYLPLPGKAITTEGKQYWSAHEQLISMVLMQIIEDLPVYNKESLSIDVFNGNGIGGFAGNMATVLRSHGFSVDQVDNAQLQDKTTIFYSPEYKLAAMELAIILDVDADLQEGSYLASNNPIAVILGRDLGGN